MRVQANIVEDSQQCIDAHMTHIGEPVHAPIRAPSNSESNLAPAVLLAFAPPSTPSILSVFSVLLSHEIQPCTYALL